MKRFLASIIGTLASLSLAAPASAKGTVAIRGTLLPAGFCTQADDGSLGVRFDGTSYDVYLALYALANPDEVYRDLLKLHNGNELVAGQELANLRKAAHEFQRLSIDKGQHAKCR